jgi:hypothetical protein
MGTHASISVLLRCEGRTNIWERLFEVVCAILRSSWDYYRAQLGASSVAFSGIRSVLWSDCQQSRDSLKL